MSKFFLYLAMLAPLCFAQNVYASNDNELQKDFKTVRGTILLQIDEQYVTDLDYDAGINVGDVMTLVISKNKVFDQNNLHDQVQPVGFFQVTGIKRGYAYLKHIQGKIKPKKGSQIIRYQAVPAQFINESEINTEQIKGLLSNFRWLDQSSRKKPLMTFRLEGGRLSVLGPQNALLYQYKVENNIIKPLVKPQRPVLPFKDSKPQGRFKSIINKAVDFIQ